MTCEACEEARIIDEVTPDCESGRGCLIPALDDEGLRIIEIYARIRSLEGLVDAAAILQMYTATPEDLAMLAIVKEEMAEAKEQDHGANSDDN
ncbi:MAG: hypothetical protein M0024_01285 [Nitrospiraceae bacterium]|nr:hypothetical protein [Nitrospiraceae bacterium]